MPSRPIRLILPVGQQPPTNVPQNVEVSHAVNPPHRYNAAPFYDDVAAALVALPGAWLTLDHGSKLISCEAVKLKQALRRRGLKVSVSAANGTLNVMLVGSGALIDGVEVFNA
jgi:hypothetical protein